MKKVEVIIYSWRQFANDRKHQYAKIIEDGVVIAEEGGAGDRHQFFTIHAAVSWAERFIHENIKDSEISLSVKKIGDGPNVLATGRKLHYLREGD